MEWADDTVEYLVVGLVDAVDLRQVAEKANSAEWQAKVLGSGYLWNREKFFLSQWEQDGVRCLKGTTPVGDSLEDARSVAALLRVLSHEYADSIAARVYDDDGEFLLIEGAEYVPRWLGPDIAANRVWIYGGRVCLVPKSSDFGRRRVQFGEAAKWLRAHRQSLRPDNNLDLAVFGQDDEPKDELFHHAAVRLPRRALGVLLKHPQALTHALDAFFTRDQQADAILRTMPVLRPGDDDVDAILKFTRRQYVELVAGEPQLPPIFGDAKTQARTVGAQVACGLELLIHDFKDGQAPSKATVRDNAGFRDYVAAVSNDGIFGGHLPGTDRYNEIWNFVADQYLLSRQLSDQCYQVSASARSPTLRLPTNDEIRSRGTTSDPEDWLADKPPELDDLDNMNPDELLGRVQRFMDDTQAGLRGVDDRIGVIDEEDDSEGDNDDDDDDASTDSGDSALHPTDPNDPQIDLDDFVEFFMRDALKLSPEEIESYRADNFEPSETRNAESEHPDEGDDFARLEQTFAQDADIDPEELMRNLRQSIREGGLDGPAAAFIRQILSDSVPPRR